MSGLLIFENVVILTEIEVFIGFWSAIECWRYRSGVFSLIIIYLSRAESAYRKATNVAKNYKKWSHYIHLRMAGRHLFLVTMFICAIRYFLRDSTAISQCKCHSLFRTAPFLHVSANTKIWWIIVRVLSRIAQWTILIDTGILAIPYHGSYYF